MWYSPELVLPSGSLKEKQDEHAFLLKLHMHGSLNGVSN